MSTPGRVAAPHERIARSGSTWGMATDAIPHRPEGIIMSRTIIARGASLAAIWRIWIEANTY